jgi:hypothetical protein
MPSLRSMCALTSALGALATIALAACAEGKDPMAAGAPERGVAASVAVAAGGEAGTLGTIPLPVNQTISNANRAFGITNTGAGGAGGFIINNVNNSRDALFAQTNSNASGYAFHARATGLGSAGFFENTNAGNGSNTLYVTSPGSGNALSVVNTGTGWAGVFAKTNSSGSNATIFAQNPSGGAAIQGLATGTGWAGQFEGNGPSARGVLVVTQGGAGLQVLGGSKSAVVRTPGGARALYTEEATEVWFTDYGFGRLTNGRARILLDPAFAQTINVDEPYHVFVQAYGDAELYVRHRTSLGFEVVFRGGNDRGAEFGYRIVAKRLGFETARLEPAPWVDESPR